MTPRARWWIAFAFASAAACSYNPSTGGLGPSDGATDGPPPLPDAGPCTAAGAMCFTDGSNGEVLQTCTAEGAQPVIDPCSWGCVTTGTAHCGVLQPKGDAVLPAHTQPQPGETLLDITITADTIFNTDTGEITGGVTRAAVPGIDAGIEFISRNNVGIFRMRSLTLSASKINPTGVNGIALVALETIELGSEIDLRRCNEPQNPGGSAGGATKTAGGGVGGGGAGGGSSDNNSGGGGGGHGGGGGQGGAGQSEPRSTGGDFSGTPELLTLIGGGGGGGGTAARGGNGGGAIQLVANGTISLTATGRVNASGCGGQAGQNNQSAAGGGAGGAILIEAPSVVMAAAAVVAVNGGGGGGGDAGGQNGQNGGASLTAAGGGNGAANGGNGGAGGADQTFNGSDGISDRNGGGGGGGVGRIRINTRDGTATLAGDAVISPALVQGSTSTLGTATVQ